MTHLVKMTFFFRRNLWMSLSYRVGLVLGLLSTSISLLQVALLGHFLQEGNTFPGIAQYGGNILAFIITGSVFTSFVAVALSGVSSFIQHEQGMGTLEAMLTTSTRVTQLMAYSGVVALIGTVLNTAALLGLVLLLFGVPLAVNPAGVVAALSALLFALFGFGLASTGVLLVTKQGDPITWTLTTVTTLLSGVLYPVDVLPHWAQAISRALPTTQALDALRLALLQQASPARIAAQLQFLALWGAVSVTVGLLVLRWGLRKARRQGSFGEF